MMSDDQLKNLPPDFNALALTAEERTRLQQAEIDYLANTRSLTPGEQLLREMNEEALRGRRSVLLDDHERNRLPEIIKAVAAACDQCQPSDVPALEMAHSILCRLVGKW